MNDPKDIALRNKQLIRETIAGYAAAAEIIEQERIERLPKLTLQESWAEFESLAEFGRRLQGDPDSLRIFNTQRIEDHVYVRQVFEKLARSRGLI
jgi:hypothetical protein